MRKRKFAHVLDGFCLCSRRTTCVATENYNVQKRVAHKSVSAVNTAYRFACHEQVFNRGFAVAVDIYTAVLIVQRGIDEDRFFADIDSVLIEHTEHCGNTFHNSALAADLFDHRRIQPDALSVGSFDTVAALVALADNGSRGYVTRFERIDERFAVLVNELCAERTNLFGYERAENLRGFRNARGVILKRIGVKKFCARAVSKYQTVRGCAVVVTRREALIVQSACAARCDDNGLCLSDRNLARFHIEKYRARSLAVFILDNLYRGGEIHNGNIAVKHLVAQSSHNLRTRVVLAGVHSLSRSAAAVRGYHIAVFVLIEHNAEIGQPFDSRRRFVNKHFQKLGLSGKVSAAERVEVVNRRAVVFFIGSLNTAFRHHRVCVAYTKLGNYHYVCAVGVCGNSRARTCAAAAYYKHVYVVSGVFEVDIQTERSRFALQKRGKFVQNLIALVFAHFKIFVRAFDIIGMIFL